MLTGRTDFLDKLTNTRTPSSLELQECDSVRTYWCRIQLILSMRAVLIQANAELPIQQACSKQLRTAVDESILRINRRKCGIRLVDFGPMDLVSLLIREETLSWK